MLLLLLADASTVSFLVRRFCVAFSVYISGELSSNPLLVRTLSIGCPFTSHSISCATAVQVKFAVLLSAPYTDFGGTTIPVM